VKTESKMKQKHPMGYVGLKCATTWISVKLFLWRKHSVQGAFYRNFASKVIYWRALSLLFPTLQK